MFMRVCRDVLFVVPALSVLSTKQNDATNLERSTTIKRCTCYVEQKMLELGCPGLVIGVAVDGKPVWTKGFGYSDLENNVPCTPETVMRIASISKSFTMAAVAKLIENGKLDIEAPVQTYVPSFPVKKFNGKDVSITTEMLLSHTSGLRHYNKTENEEIGADGNVYDEFYSMKQYNSVTESLDIFKNDPLIHKPGKKFLYTTHGWTLVSAVVEGASGENFLEVMQNLFLKFGMKSTLPESTKKIIYNRARHYMRSVNGRLENVPYVDLSYKWAGGGFLSTVPDLLKFGNVMLYSYQNSDTSPTSKSFLKQETVRMIWTPAVKTKKKTGDQSYGFGWTIYPRFDEIGCGFQRDFEVTHTGGAVGASSVLYICPDNSQEDTNQPESSIESVPQGIVVAVITNLQSVDLTEIARNVAKEFKFVAL